MPKKFCDRGCTPKADRHSDECDDRRRDYKRIKMAEWRKKNVKKGPQMNYKALYEKYRTKYEKYRTKYGPLDESESESESEDEDEEEDEDEDEEESQEEKKRIESLQREHIVTTFESEEEEEEEELLDKSKSDKSKSEEEEEEEKRMQVQTPSTSGAFATSLRRAGSSKTVKVNGIHGPIVKQDPSIPFFCTKIPDSYKQTNWTPYNPQ